MKGQRNGDDLCEKALATSLKTAARWLGRNCAALNPFRSIPTKQRFKSLAAIATVVALFFMVFHFAVPKQYYPGHSYAHAATRARAEKGDAEAQFLVGYKYEWGREGVPRMDKAEALKWFRKSAAQNYAEAQTELGQMYANGEGVPKDEAEAARAY